MCVCWCWLICSRLFVFCLCVGVCWFSIMILVWCCWLICWNCSFFWWCCSFRLYSSVLVLICVVVMCRCIGRYILLSCCRSCGVSLVYVVLMYRCFLLMCLVMFGWCCY